MSAKSTSASTARSFPVLLVACGCLIALMTFGPRSAMGFFLIPMLEDRGFDRTTFGLAMAICTPRPSSLAVALRDRF